MSKKIISVSESQRLTELNDIKEYHKQDKKEKRQFLSKFFNDRAFLKKHCVSNRLVVKYETNLKIDVDNVLSYVNTLSSFEDKVNLILIFKAVSKQLLPYKSLKNLIDLIKSVN